VIKIFANENSVKFMFNTCSTPASRPIAKYLIETYPQNLARAQIGDYFRQKVAQFFDTEMFDLILERMMKFLEGQHVSSFMSSCITWDNRRFFDRLIIYRHHFEGVPVMVLRSASAIYQRQNYFLDTLLENFTFEQKTIRQTCLDCAIVGSELKLFLRHFRLHTWTPQDLDAFFSRATNFKNVEVFNYLLPLVKDDLYILKQALWDFGMNRDINEDMLSTLVDSIRRLDSSPEAANAELFNTAVVIINDWHLRPEDIWKSDIQMVIDKINHPEPVRLILFKLLVEESHGSSNSLKAFLQFWTIDPNWILDIVHHHVREKTHINGRLESMFRTLFQGVLAEKSPMLEVCRHVQFVSAPCGSGFVYV
jgi:hypothetical protein